MSTRWLDDDEMRAWTRFLTTATLVLEALDRDIQAAHGRSMAEYEVLARLSAAEEGRLRMRELADLALQSRSRLTHTVDRLEAEGLVERVPCESDRRGMWAVLTPAGLALLEAMAPLHVEGVRRTLLDALDPDDVRALGAILDKVAHALGRTPPAP